MATQPALPLISVIIVNYKVAGEICQLLRSLVKAELYEAAEVIIVDNASMDNSFEIITAEFPRINWIPLKNNIGFGKACNVASQNARGAFLLFLNPDTLVSQNTLRVAVDFLQSHPDVGIMGPKIIKPDGRFQPQCRRSFPTPLNAFAYFTGLSRMFPKSKVLGQYNISPLYISPDISMEVDAVSGSFMFMRAALFSEIGGFDGSFFMYGEDLDLCARVKQHGNKVWYQPATQIIHFTGQSCTKNMLRSRMAFYNAMILFSKKYHHSYGAFFPGWFITLGTLALAALNIGTIALKSSTACFIDLLLINSTVWAATVIRFYPLHIRDPYASGNILIMTGMHVIISLCYLLTFAFRGVYASKSYSAHNTFYSSLIASAIFMSGIFFIQSMAFSRVAFAASAGLLLLLLTGWRTLLPRSIKQFKRWIYTTGDVIIVGNSPIASALIKETEQDKTALICGIVWPDDDASMPGEFEGYPVLGRIGALSSILKRRKADLILIATNAPWYSGIIETLSFVPVKHLKIRWVPHTLFDLPPEKIPQPIPLNDFSV